MLNVLIAIVSDSYDFAMTRASQLFLRTRLGLVAELDALDLTTEIKLSPELIECLEYASNNLGKFSPDKALRLGNLTKDGENDWTGRIRHM